MKKLFIAAAVAACLPLALAAQDTTLKDFSKTMQSDDLPLSIIHLNAKTVPLLFMPPTLYQIRAKANESTMIYVQTTVENNAELDTTTFTIEQDGMTYPGTPSSVRNFTKGKVKLKLGDQVLVKVLAIEGNKIRLSRKAVLREQRDKQQREAAGG